MKGDALASGQERATFSVAPGMRFNEGEMRDDLIHISAGRLTHEQFIIKYMVTQRELDMLLNTNNEEKVSSFAEEMKQRAELANRQLAAEKKQEDQAINRECFLTPFVVDGFFGRVIVARDGPIDKPSNLYVPRTMRKDKTLPPTTGHVIKETIAFEFDHPGYSLIGKRVLFAPMSGTAICFKGYPTWIQLELSEILAIVNKEDVELQEETLEPMI